MIIVDIETCGIDPRTNCMLSLGAVDYDTGRDFYGECSTYPDTLIDPVAMEICGFDIKDVQPGKKQLAHALYASFVRWARGSCADNVLAGHNVGHFDILFLEHYHMASIGLGKFPFSYRTVDLHSIAFAVFGKSMKHSDICLALGLPAEPKPHNALSGARSERDAFRELFAMQTIDDTPKCQRHSWCGKAS